MKRIGILVLALCFAFSLAGCATARKQREEEMQGLRNQITTLESQVQSKDEEINGLKDQLSKASEANQEQAAQKSGMKIVPSVKSRPTPKHIQIALTNAGYDVGKIDGKMGKQTKDAIKAFQKANNLTVSGKADKKTWAALKDYLYKKTK